MQYKVAQGNMSFLARQAKQGHLDNIGVSMDDFRKVTQDVPWLGVDRSRVNSTLNTLITSTVDIIGMSRFQLPAEYIAAGIAMFVAPINVNAACIWMERAPTSEDLGRGLDEPLSCTASQLFALVTQLLADPEHSSAKHLFEKNTSIAIGRSKEIDMSKALSKDK